MNHPSLQSDHAPDDRLLSFREVADLVGLRGTATKALVRRPGFPPVVRLSQRTPRWWRSDVLRWLDAQLSTYSIAPTGYCRSPRRPRRTHQDPG